MNKQTTITLALSAALIASFIYIQSQQQTINSLLQENIANQKKLEKERDNTVYERNKDCRNEALDLKKRWNNIQNGSYDEATKECWVSYKDTKTNNLEHAPISGMSDV